MFAHQARRNWREFLTRLIEEPLAAIDLMKRLTPNDGSGNTSGSAAGGHVRSPALKKTSTPADPTLGQLLAAAMRHRVCAMPVRHG